MQMPHGEGIRATDVAVENPPRVRVFELCRFLADVAPDSVLATANARQVDVLPDMTQICSLRSAPS